MKNIALIFLILFITFFSFSVLLWFKLFFEINRFKKLELIKERLILLQSSFFLNKLIELKNLAQKKSQYKKIYKYFFQKYQNLFDVELDRALTLFFKMIADVEQPLGFLIEQENKIQDFKKIQDIIDEIENFANELRKFSNWENFCFDKVHEFNLIINRIEEEIAKSKIKVAFDYSLIIKKNDDLRNNINIFKNSILEFNYQIIFDNYINLEKQIEKFTKDCLLWLKLINLLMLSLPKKHEANLRLIAKLALLDKHIFTNEFITIYQKKINKLVRHLTQFDLFESQKLLLELVDFVDSNNHQLRHHISLRAIFLKSFNVLSVNFKNLSNNFATFQKFWKKLDQKFFDQKFQESGIIDFNQLLIKNQKIIDNLFINQYQIEKIYSFNNILINELHALQDVKKMHEIYFQMEAFFSVEKENNRYLFLLLISLNVLFEKYENAYLKSFYQKDLTKCWEIFLSFENETLSVDHHSKDFNSLLNNLKKQLFSLKSNIKNTILLKYLVEKLFVKVNSKRFESDVYRNKILNCEILYLKKDYKAVLETLLDIFEESSRI